MEIILNIEADHLDFFKDIEDIRHSFRKFAELLPENGILIINSDIHDYKEICDGLPIKVITVGSDPAKSHYSAADVTFNENACATYTLLEDGKQLIQLHWAFREPTMYTIPWRPSRRLMSWESAEEGIKNGLLRFTGTHRRFEKKGEIGGADHHR